MNLDSWQSVTDQVVQKISGWVETGAAMLPNLVVALLVLVLGWLLAKLVYRGSRATMARAIDNAQLVQLGARMASAGTLLVAFMVALGVLQLDKTVASLLAGVGIAGVALGFAFQDIAANLISGVMMAVQRPIRIGDMVETNGYRGMVTAVDLRSTLLRTFTGETVVVPNKDVYGKAVTNYTDSPKRRVDLSCGVSYADDLRRIERLVQEALDDLPERCEEDEIKVYFTGFGGSSIDFTVQVWLEMAQQRGFLRARSEMIMRIKETFDSNGVTIPFPIRTVDFGIEGGLRLDQALENRGSQPIAEAR